MEKTEQLLGEYIKSNYQVQRLPDREFREGKSFYRKSAYLLSIDSYPLYVIYRFHPQYISIFHNYLKARNTVAEIMMGQMWEVDFDKLLIVTNYLGNQCAASNDTHIGNVVNLLKRLNQVKQTFELISVPSYFTSLLKLNHKRHFFYLKHLTLLIEFFFSNRKYGEVGCGIRDPAISNFTHLNSNVFLVDWDNFNTNVCYQYEIGFLLSDIDIQTSNITESNNVVNIISRASNLAQENLDIQLVCMGYIARITTELIDACRSKVSPNKILHLNNVIESLSYDLLRICS
jgi:hypothetical protein